VGRWVTASFASSIQSTDPSKNSKAEAMFPSDAVVGAWKRILGWAKKDNVKVAFGTDLPFDPAGTRKENLMLTWFAQIFSDVEVLKIATSGNCKRLC
jgi:imidazolonepropionase-like amidohydrolase